MAAEKKVGSVVPLFRRGASYEGEEELAVGLPPSSSSQGTKPKTSAAADLGGKPPVWLLIGPGGSGKTTIARWLGWRASEVKSPVSLAALDPTNRTLAGFFDGVHQPETADPVKTARWLRDLVQWVMDAKARAVLDMGGGDTSLAKLIEDAPTIAADMEEAGVAPVAAYVLSPRLDDLATLATFEERGFQPQATVLVLNEAKVDATMGREEAFGRVMRHGAFRRAVERGAQVVWMPVLDQELALEIEAKRLQFDHARDGTLPEGRSGVPVSGLRRSMVRRWLERMEAEFAPVRSWLP